jgi:membrane-associated phospholipid phosphatase
MNRFHGATGDAIFPWITELANGWAPVVLALALLFRSWRSFLMMGLATGLSALAAQFLKRVVFSGHDRPSMYLDHMPGLHLVPGIELHHHFSFPSGHGTAAFSMCLALAVLIGKRGAGVGFALLAALLAYSRVYLSQHFTEDILAGALLGTAVATGVYWMLFLGPWAKTTALDRSPFRHQNQ